MFKSFIFLLKSLLDCVCVFVDYLQFHIKISPWQWKKSWFYIQVDKFTWKYDRLVWWSELFSEDYLAAVEVWPKKKNKIFHPVSIVSSSAVTDTQQMYTTIQKLPGCDWNSTDSN